MHARIRFRQPQLAGVNPAPPPVEDVPGQGVELLDFEQAAPNAAAQFRLREVLEDELGLEDAPEIPVGAVETVLGAEAYQSFQGYCFTLLRQAHNPAYCPVDAVTWPGLSEA